MVLFVRSNVALEEGEGVWIRCLKSFGQKEKKYLVPLWTWEKNDRIDRNGLWNIL